MINPFNEVNWNPDRIQKRRFAASLIIGFPCIATLMLLLMRLFSGSWNFTLPLWIAIAGITTGAFLWLVPAIARPFYIVWYGFACSIGIVISNLLMAGFYYTIFTGTGLLRRALSKSGLRKTVDPSAKTYWEDVEQDPSPERYYRHY